MSFDLLFATAMDLQVPSREECVRNLSIMHEQFMQVAKTGDDKLLMDKMKSPMVHGLLYMSILRAGVGFPLYKMLGKYTNPCGGMLAWAYYFRFSKNPMVDGKMVNKVSKVAGKNFTLALFSALNHDPDLSKVVALSDATCALMKQLDLMMPPDEETIMCREMAVMCCNCAEFNATEFDSIAEENMQRETLLNEVAAFGAKYGDAAVAELYQHDFALNVD